ncbi:MAG: PAS domain S-box protein [Halovenus sp.]
MRATTDRETFICLTRRGTVSEVDADGVRLEEVDGPEVLRSRLRTLPADGVLVGEDSADEWLADSESFRREFPAVPVLVFSADRDAAFVERALETGGTDVVRSTLAGTPPSLIRTRLDSLTAGSEGTSPPIAERYETMLNTAADAVYLLDSEGEIVAVNDSATALTGFSREELVGSPGSRYVDEETAEQGTERVKKQLEADAEFGTFEAAIETKEGAPVPCEVRVSVLTVDGEFAGTVGIVRDLSAKRDRERELEKQGELLEHLSQNLTEVVWVNDPDQAGVEFISAGYEEIWGRPRKELSDGKHALPEGIHPEDRERVREMLRESSKGQTSRDVTYRVVRPDGEVRWVNSETFGVYEGDTLERMVGITTDITERKEREQELQAERDLIENIYEASPVGIGVFDADGRLTRANERIVEVFGVDREVLLDASLEEIPTDLCDGSGERLPLSELPVREILRTGEPVYGHEVTVLRPDGTDVWISWNGEPIVDESGEVTRVVATVEDISERKRRERKVATQRDELVKLAHINRIIRDVHDVLVGATSRDEIEQTVCERLTASGQYSFGLFHRLTPEGSLEPQAWTAKGREHVDRAFPIENAATETSPGVRALATREVQAIQSLRTVEEKEPWQEVAVDVGIESLAAIPVIYDGCEYGVIGVYATEEGAFGERELDVLGELGGTVGHAIAALESREREETLTTLYEATQDLLAAETATAVSDVVVETAREVLAPPGLGVFLFDDDRNALVPAAAPTNSARTTAVRRCSVPGRRIRSPGGRTRPVGHSTTGTSVTQTG